MLGSEQTQARSVTTQLNIKQINPVSLADRRLVKPDKSKDKMLLYKSLYNMKHDPDYICFPPMKGSHI